MSLSAGLLWGLHGLTEYIYLAPHHLAMKSVVLSVGRRLMRTVLRICSNASLSPDGRHRLNTISTLLPNTVTCENNSRQS